MSSPPWHSVSPRGPSTLFSSSCQILCVLSAVQASLAPCLHINCPRNIMWYHTWPESFRQPPTPASHCSFSLDYGWSLGENWVKHHRIYQISLYNLKAAIWRGKIEAWSQKDQIYIANIRRWPTAGKLAALLFWPPWRELPITAFCVQYFPPLVAL